MQVVPLTNTAYTAPASINIHHHNKPATDQVYLVGEAFPCLIEMREDASQLKSVHSSETRILKDRLERKLVTFLSRIWQMPRFENAVTYVFKLNDTMVELETV
jgi:hypothetical protein